MIESVHWNDVLAIQMWKPQAVGWVEWVWMGGNLEAWWLSHDPFAKLQGVLPLARGLFIKFCFCWPDLHHASHTIPFDVLVVGMKSLEHQHTFTLCTHIFLHIPHLFLLAGSPSWVNAYGCKWSPLGWIPQFGLYDFGRVHDISCIPLPMCGIQKEFWAYLEPNGVSKMILFHRQYLYFFFLSFMYKVLQFQMKTSGKSPLPNHDLTEFKPWLFGRKEKHDAVFESMYKRDSVISW
jgi:hypothetical protein